MTPDTRVHVPGAGTAGLPVAAKPSAACTVRAVCRASGAGAIRRRGFTRTGIRGGGTYRSCAAEAVPGDGRYNGVNVASGPGEGSP